MNLIVLILLIMLILGLVPMWPYNRGWAGPVGYSPLVVVLIILILFLILRPGPYW